MRADAELIRAAREDASAFAELYRRRAHTVYRFTCSRTDSRTAEDLTAETFAQAALSLKRFRDEAQGSSVPWLLGIAKNLVRRYREEQRIETAARHRLGMSISTEEVDLEATAEPVRADGLACEIDGALALLPSGQRQALQLRAMRLPQARAVAWRTRASRRGSSLRGWSPSRC